MSHSSLSRRGREAKLTPADDDLLASTPRACSEALSEDTAFQSRQLAALVASKVYYHLGNLAEALSFALGAGKLFDVERTAADNNSSPSEAEYVDTIICQYSLSFVAWPVCLGR